MSNSFGAQDTLTIGDKSCTIYKLSAVEKIHPQAAKLPFALKILLENLLRHEDGNVVTKEDIEALAKWDAKAKPSQEIAFTPSRVLLQDFTGVPAIVDLAAMRDAMETLGGEASKINPLQPVELVIDHSVQVDQFGAATALAANSEIEYARNRERYMFLRWGQNAFDNFRVVPPETGIVHQVNLEHLARVVFRNDATNTLYPDTLVGTDSHTTMINGVGVLGWGVGGIEAEAAMLGQPISMLIPQVVGFKLTGKLAEGATATDLVLTVTEMLRKKGVVGKFVEFYGSGLASLPLADRATIANMAPEYGATCGIFPIDEETLRYLRLTGRSEEHVARVEAYAKAQGLFHTAQTPEAVYSDTLELDISTVVPSLAGPKRPQDRVPLAEIKSSFEKELPSLMSKAGSAPTSLQMSGEGGGTAVATQEAAGLQTGSVVIAAITSCTNTSNPSVMLAAGLVAKKAAEKGLTRKPWVKTSLAPGSKAVTEYLQKADLLGPLEKLGFYLVGYGCTTCIAEGTPVLLSNGTSRPIEQMPSAGGSLVFGPTENNELTVAAQLECMPKGIRECLAVTLQDGRTLVCTPDHEILTAAGQWVRADSLVSGESRVVVGLEAPTDTPEEDETDYMLVAGEMTFTMDTTENRLRTLAFARIVGHLLGDGSISVAGQGRMNVGQIIDAETLLNDIELLTGQRPAGSQYDDRKWSIALPLRLTEAIVRLGGVRVGRRIDQEPRLPDFVLDPNCPVAVVREFLGGVFGADGKAATLKRLGEKEYEAILHAPAYAQSAKPEHVEPLKQVMHQLVRLLDRCGVQTKSARLYEYPVRRSESSYPAARDGVNRTEVRLELPDGLSFVERVGFRYCVDKRLRSSAAAVYWRTVNKIHHQRLWMAARLEDLHRERPELSFSQARRIAAAELTEREPVVFPHYSLLEGHDRFSRLPNPENRKFQPLHRDSCGFPSPVKMLEDIGARDRFAKLLPREETDYSKRYCLDKYSKTLPTLSLGVIDVRPAGPRNVYDIAVDGVHAFVAGTFCVHNCIGNSGPLPEEVSAKIHEDNLVVASVLSGNRNFEGRVHAEVRANYLASPPLVVVYALAGRIDFDPYNEPLGEDSDGNPVFMKDIWPTTAEIHQAVQTAVQGEMFSKVYQDVFKGDERWSNLPVPEGDLYAWDEKSTYVKNPPYFEGMGPNPDSVTDIKGARLLALLGDSITTDHISPAGSIKTDSPAGKYLIEHGVEPKDFNSYGSRRGNHEVMMRGTFANVRIRNKLAPGTEGGYTRHFPDGAQMTIYDAAMQYKVEGVPLMVIAGKEYGTGSSRDWAAKGPRLLGIRAVIAESYERIHRSNLVGMGVLPLQFHDGESAESLGLTGEETFDVEGLPTMFEGAYKAGQSVNVKATANDGTSKTFQALVRIDTPQEAEYYRHGGILQYVLRQLAGRGA